MNEEQKARKKARRKIREATPEWRENRRIRDRAYREVNPDKFRAYDKKRRKYANRLEYMKKYLEKYNAIHRKAVNGYKKKWKQNNQSKVTDHMHRRRVCMDRRNDTAAIFIAFVRSQKWIPCYWCKNPARGNDAHIDHVIALSKGGNHCSSNLCASCETCNLSKNAKLPSEWKRHPQMALNL